MLRPFGILEMVRTGAVAMAAAAPGASTRADASCSTAARSAATRPSCLLSVTRPHRSGAAQWPRIYYDNDADLDA